jgi:thiol-disulfide isomerase/thioredoxin
MTTPFKNAIIALIMIMFPLSAVAKVPEEGQHFSEQVQGTTILAVDIYADWCPSCRAFDPKMNAAIASGDWGGISFAKIDFTRRDRKAFFEEAESFGVGEAFRDLFSRGIKDGPGLAC